MFFIKNSCYIYQRDKTSPFIKYIEIAMDGEIVLWFIFQGLLRDTLK